MRRPSYSGHLPRNRAAAHRVLPRCAAAFLTLILLIAAPAAAQEIGRIQEQVAAGTSYRVFARPGDATVQVVVVADQGSGVYEVASDTDLGKLVALTGGFSAPERTARRHVTISLLRQQGAIRQTVYEASLEQLLREPGRHPALLEGDVLTVETSGGRAFNWRDALTISTAVATLSWTLRSVFSGN